MLPLLQDYLHGLGTTQAPQRYTARGQQSSWGKVTLTLFQQYGKNCNGGPPCKHTLRLAPLHSAILALTCR
jgi:hypothetical protein